MLSRQRSPENASLRLKREFGEGVALAFASVFTLVCFSITPNANGSVDVYLAFTLLAWSRGDPASAGGGRAAGSARQSAARRLFRPRSRAGSDRRVPP